MEHEIQPDVSMSVAVVEAVSEAEGCRPTALPKLSDVINPDALNRLFVETSGRRSERSGELSFVFSNSRVTVDDSGTITVEPKSTAQMSI